MGFQSLIGRLKTDPDRAEIIGINPFQSLIGRLKTQNNAKMAREVGNKFQSLIGRLKT